MTPRDRDGSFTHTHGVMHLLPTGVKKVNCGRRGSSENPAFFYRCTKDAHVDPAEVSKKGGILLVNLLQSSRSTFSRGSLFSFFALKGGMLSTPISVLGGWPTVSGGFFYCPNEAIDHRDRGQIMLECGQIIRKVTDQRRSAIRTGPAGSDKPEYVTEGLSIHLLVLGTRL